MKYRPKSRNLKRRTTGSLIIEHNQWLVNLARERLVDGIWSAYYREMASYLHDELHRRGVV